jgi:GntR family transcriptional regulator
LKCIYLFQEGGKKLKIIISNSSSNPIYQQIFNQIQQAIFKGELKEGEALPSIRSQ